jgi:hypothetical protein
MAQATKELLSGSIDGLGIVVVSGSGGTAGTAGTIHVAAAGTSGRDEVYLWAFNGHTSNVVLSLEWGTSGNPRVITIPFQSGLIPIVPGLPLCNGQKIQAFAATPNVVVIDGFVNRITN